MTYDTVVLILIIATVLLIAILGFCFFAFFLFPILKRTLAQINEFYKYPELHEHEFLAMAKKSGWTYSREVPEGLKADFEAFQNHYPGGKKDCFLIGRANGQPVMSFEMFVYEPTRRATHAQPRYHHWRGIMLFGLDLDLPEFSLTRNAGRKLNVMQKYELISRSPQAAAVLNPTALAILDASNALFGWGSRSSICVFRDSRSFEPPSWEDIMDLLKDTWEFSEAVRVTTPFARPLKRS